MKELRGDGTKTKGKEKGRRDAHLGAELGAASNKKLTAEACRRKKGPAYLSLSDAFFSLQGKSEKRKSRGEG